jgi:hypothetical protein
MLASLYWNSLHSLPITLLLLAGIAAVTLWLYPPQVRLLRQPWRWGLPGLRTAALGALVISILQPVLIRPKTAVERGAVVMLLDDSQSMSVIDEGRSPSQRVALAAALGRLPAGARDALAAALQSDADRLSSLADAVSRARGEVDYARLAGRGIDAATARLDQTAGEFQAAAQSAATQAASLKGRAGLQKSLAVLADPPSGAARGEWLNRLHERVKSTAAEVEQATRAADEQLFRTEPQVHDVCQDLAKLSRLELEQAATMQGVQSLTARLGPDVPVLGFGVGDRVTPFSPRDSAASASAAPLAATGSISNLTGGVRAVLDHLQGTAVRAVVLFSDGRQVGGEAAVPSSLSASGVPVYTVGVAPLGGLKDVSIINVTAPSSAFVGETVTVRADIRALGLPNAQADVTFDAGGEKQARHVVFADEKPVTVEFTEKLTTPGPRKISLVVSKVPGEATDENNHVERWIKVLQQKIKVAAYAGTAGWDYQYVRNALTRTPWAELKDGILPDADAKLSLTPDELLKQDVVLLFDVAVGSLDTAQWDAVNRLVTERGGSVILAAGDAHLPSEYAAGALTSSLLPYAGGNPPAWRTWPGERPAFHLTPAPGAMKLDALRLGDSAESPERRWQQLPAFFRFLPVSPLKPNTKPLLVESESGLPVLTESRLGAGRVLFLGANETWRWRYKAGETEQDRFWLQLIRYAAEQPYAIQQGGVSLDADVVSTTPNKPIHVRARVETAGGLPQKVVECNLHILRDGKNVRTQQMIDSGNGRYAATITDLPEGDYELQADPGNPLPQPKMALHVQRSTEAEMADLSGDDTVLRHLARSSGGEYLRLDQVDALPSKLIAGHDESSRFVETSLWDSPYLYAFVLGCLGTEWSLRKRFGLA